VEYESTASWRLGKDDYIVLRVRIIVNNIETRQLYRKIISTLIIRARVYFSNYENTMMRIGFLGAGKMAQALANGFLKAGKFRLLSTINEYSEHGRRTI
jgi:hypothetical protein